MLHFFSAILAFATVGAGTPSCLPDAIPSSARKQIGSVGSYPIGVWVNGWPAGHAMAEVVAILIKEVMGYEVELKGPGSGTPQGFFALAGCRNPTNTSHPECDGVTHTLVHVNVEGWTTGYFSVWKMIQEKYPKLAPKNLGNSGYDGAVSTYITKEVQERGYHAEGLSLDFYREYNVSWHDPSKYFANWKEVDTSRLSFCNETKLVDFTEMKAYLSQSGDTDGVISEGDQVTARCWEDHFWLSPDCREDEARCIPLFTGGDGWSVGEMMQKVTGFNMAVVIAFGKGWGNYATLPLEMPSIFYWWVPDPTFLRKTPVAIMYPPTDRLAWESGDMRSQYAATSIDKHVSKDLGALAPEVEKFMGSFLVSLEDVNSIMMDKMNSEDDSHFDAACRWVKGNRPRWTTMLPDQTACYPGFGLYDKLTKSFVLSRSVGGGASTSSIDCQACPSGHFSEILQDDKGTTYTCQACPPGTSQELGASLTCEPCPKGEYQSARGSLFCLRCDVGTYQDVTGQAECNPCPQGTNTLGLGGLSLMDCSCEAGSMDMARSDSDSSEGNSTVECQPCAEGLRCPFGSSLWSFMQGPSTSEDTNTPQTKPGYVSSVSETGGSISIFKCNPSSNCPGGQPGTCADELEGEVCSRCSAGTSFDGKRCSKCEDAIIFLWWFLLALALSATTAAYYGVNQPGSTKASPVQQVMMTTSLVVHAAQTLAVFSLMGVTWPSSFADTSSQFQILMLDLSKSSLTCVTGWDDMVRFSLSVAAFPVLTAWLFTCWALSKFLLRRCNRDWALSHTWNTIGMFLQAGFASMSVIALEPMMCYRHPNGKYSVLKYPSTMCGDDSQVTMLVLGVILLVSFVVGFFVLCAIAAYCMPAWSAAKDREKVQAFRFLSGKFRLDMWWFGLVPLLRGFCFSLVIALATDMPRAQIMLATTILLAYFGIQVRYYPWKSEPVNVADFFLNALLLLSINLSTQEVSASEAQFTNDASLVIMILLLLCIGILLLFNAYDFVLLLKPEWRRDDRSSTVEEALIDCAEKLLSGDQTSEKLKNLNRFDMKALERAIAIISMELQDGRWSSMQRRTNSASMNRTLRGSRHNDNLSAPKAAPAPVPEVLDPVVETNSPTESEDANAKVHQALVCVAQEIGAEVTPGNLVSADL